MNDVPTREEAQEHLDYLREILGDRCSKACTHSVANTPPEYCLEARASGVLMTREEFITDLEAAPLFVYPDGDDGYVVTVVEDDKLLEIASDMANKGRWSENDRDNLYEAMCNFLATLGKDTE